jgi:hypothetical protein
VLSAIGLVVVLRRKDPPPPPVTAVQAPVKRVRWQITTTPPGAEVVRVSDGQVLGKTPWKSEQAAGSGKVGVTLRQTGFLDRQVVLDLDADTTQEVELEAVKAPGGATTEKTGPGSGKKPGKTSKPSKKQNNDNPFAPVR